MRCLPAKGTNRNLCIAILRPKIQARNSVEEITILYTLIINSITTETESKHYTHMFMR